MNVMVLAVHQDTEHRFSKRTVPHIQLLRGLGVEGDAHCGETVKHRSRVAKDPTQPNLRQVHLMHAELFDELAGKGFDVGPGDMGENITTRGIDLLALPSGTELHIGQQVVVTLTGLRNPCGQIDHFQKGLLSAVLDHASDGTLIRKAGVMAVVNEDGTIGPNDPITIKLPPPPHRALEMV